MRGVSTFDVTIDVADPIDFCSDARKNALHKVRETYQGRCYMGKYIVRVLRVERCSKCRLVTVGDLGDGVVDVTFAALWSRWSPGDALPLVELVSVNEIVVGRAAFDLTDVAAAGQPEGDFSLVGAEPVAVSLLDPSELLAVGQRVPVRVADVTYEPMGQPCATATLLTCRKRATVWRVARAERGCSRGLVAALAAALREHRRVAAAAAATDGGAALHRFFVSILSPHASGDAPLPGGFAAADLPDGEQELADWAAEHLRSGAQWTRPLERAYGSGAVCSVAGAASAGYEARAAPPEAVLADLVVGACGELHALAVLSTHYASMADITALRGVWQLMAAEQRGAA